MGGDAFEGVEKLNNQEYNIIVQEITLLLAPFCLRIEPYIALPQKQIHGDIDFLIILKDKISLQTIIGELKVDQFIKNKNHTINLVYKKKQVDLCMVDNDQKFLMTAFYKSYSGIGSYLGIFLPSKEVKLTNQGLFAMGFHKHLKYSHLLTNKVNEILQFYGMSSKIYHQGFKTRKQLYQFMRTVRFLNEEQFIIHQHKAPSKLLKYFHQYLCQVGIDINKKYQKYELPLDCTLKYFNAEKQYKEQFQQLKFTQEKHRKINNKFNAQHMMKEFNILNKDINKYKKIFKQYFDSQINYYKYIEQHDLDNLLQLFNKVCKLDKKQQIKQQQLQTNNNNKQLLYNKNQNKKQLQKSIN